jgi:hypothetical protein
MAVKSNTFSPAEHKDLIISDQDGDELQLTYNEECVSLAETCHLKIKGEIVLLTQSDVIALRNALSVCYELAREATGNCGGQG